MRYLVDSNIIIYHLNGIDVATEFIRQNLTESAISRITFVEVMSFEFSDEETANILSLLNSFEIIDTSRTIAHRCVENRKIKKIKMADNLIAATAQSNNLILVTRNTDDFRSIEVELLNPFDSRGELE